MIEIKTGTMEEKIIKILQEFYPITVKEISKKLHISKSNAEFELIKLQSKGIVEIEPLPGKTFVRLLRHDFTFVGRRHQKKFIKRKRGRIAEKEEDENDIMFG